MAALADSKISRYARNDKYVTEFMKRSTKHSELMNSYEEVSKMLNSMIEKADKFVPQKTA